MPVPERENLFQRVSHKVRDFCSKEADPSRRWFLRTTVLGVEAAVGTAVLVACRLPDRPSIPTGLPTEPLFSGEIEETKAYLTTWEEEVKQNPSLKKERMEDAAQLAIAFFNNQLGYPSDRFTGQVFLLSNAEYCQKATECGQARECTAPTTQQGFTSGFQDKAFINKESFIFGPPIIRAFAFVLHELGHLDPPTIKYNRTLEPGSDGFISHEKGLVFYLRVKGVNIPDECLPGINFPIEEAVNHDAITRMLDLLDIRVPDPKYDSYVQIYRKFILDDLYEGDPQPLLDLQKKSNRLAFVRSVGETFMKKSGSLIENTDIQIDIGSKYIDILFPDN